MSTRGNVIFLKEKLEDEQIENIFNYENHRFIDESYCIYIHSDMYPSGALNNLKEFLKIKGAIHRGNDPSYLGAWFVGFNCLKLLPFSRAMSSHDRIEIKNVPKTFEEFKKLDDFLGIGLENELDSWTLYQYIVSQNEEDKNSFDIFVFEGFEKFLGKYNTNENLEEFIDEVE